jgi:hypothetical protein
MSLVHINWQPSTKELRKFGLTILVGFALIGLVAFFVSKNPVASYYLWSIGIVFGFAGLSGTVIALPFYFIWMGIAFVMGNIMSRLIMFLIFLVVVTPLGLIMRLTGRDRLRLKKSTDASYWIDVESTSEHNYQRQF